MIDLEELKRLATERPNDFDFKPSGILKLIGEIERLRNIAETQRLTIHAQNAEIERLQAENAELRRDAGRYRNCQCSDPLSAWRKG